MVEDEFLHIAQRFTAHLHRAEYERLKALAKAQNAATIREIERPIVADAMQTTTARQRSESAQRAMKQRKALEGEGDEGAAGDGVTTPFVGTSLRGLMDAPRREGRRIMPAAGASSSSSRTRAAAGYSNKSSPQQGARSRAVSPSLPPLASSAKKMKLESASEARTATTPIRNISQHPQTRPKVPNATRPEAASSSSYATAPPRGVSRRDRKADNRRPSVHEQDDDSDDDPFGLHERRMSRKKSREQFKRPEVKGEVKEEINKVDLSSIPSFL